MPSCAFTGCMNHSKRKNKSHDITFHSFPGDEMLKHKWLIVVRQNRQDAYWTPNKHSRICSVHFKPQDIYTTNKGYRRLSKSAVPFSQAAMVSANYASPRSTSPNSLNSVNISDAESIFDTPRKAYLKRKLRTEQMKKRKLMQSNKNFKKKVKRLTKTCKSLKEALTKSKKIINVTEEQFTSC